MQNKRVVVYVGLGIVLACGLAAMAQAGQLAPGTALFCMAMYLFRGRLWVDASILALVSSVLTVFRLISWADAAVTIVTYVVWRVVTEFFGAPAPPKDGGEGVTGVNHRPL